MGNKILRVLFIIVFISISFVACVQTRRVTNARNIQEDIQKRMSQYLTKVVLPNNIEYPTKLSKVIQSIDTALYYIANNDARFVTYGRDIPNTILFVLSSDASKLDRRIIDLYNSDPDTYALLRRQFPIDDKDWYINYFTFRSTTEVLIELSVLKQQLIISYINSTHS